MKIFIRVFAVIVFCIPFNVYPQQNHSVHDNRVSIRLWRNRKAKIKIEVREPTPTSCQIENKGFIRYDYNLYLQFKNGNKLGNKLYIKKNTAEYKNNRYPNNRETSVISIFISIQNQIKGFDGVLESDFYKLPRHDDSLSVIRLVEKIIKDNKNKLSFDDVKSDSLFLEAFPSKDVNCPKNNLAPFVYVIHDRLFSKKDKYISLDEMIHPEDKTKAVIHQSIVQAGGPGTSKTDSVHFHIKYVKTKVYDSSVQVPNSRILSLAKWRFIRKSGVNNFPDYSRNMSAFVKLPDSISFVWRIPYPEDNIFHLNDTVKTVHIERNVFKRDFVIMNKCSKCYGRSSKKSYEIKNHDFQPYSKGLNTILNGKRNPRADNKKNFSHESGTVTGETKLNLITPYRFLPGDSVYVVIQKPYGFTLHNSDELSTYNSWKIDTVLVDFSKKDSCVLHWVHLKPLMVFYLDLSDLRGRQGIIDSLKQKLDKLEKDTIANQFVFYISNLKRPIVFTHWKDINKALGMIRELNPSPPNWNFDYRHLCKYIVPGRRVIIYNFYLSDGTFSSNRELITKHLIEEFNRKLHLYRKSLNEDDLRSIVKTINGLNREKELYVKVYLFRHKTIKEKDIPPKFKGDNIENEIW